MTRRIIFYNIIKGIRFQLKIDKPAEWKKRVVVSIAKKICTRVGMTQRSKVYVTHDEGSGKNYQEMFKI